MQRKQAHIHARVSRVVQEKHIHLAHFSVQKTIITVTRLQQHVRACMYVCMQQPVLVV